VARTGVHGANRLASNSLLEGAVFGARAGDAIAVDAASGTWPAPPLAKVLSIPPRVPSIPPTVPSTDVSVPAFTREALQELLWEDAGLMRDAAGLEHAASVIAEWRRTHRSPVTEAEYEDENLLLVGEQLVAAALRRDESVGAHFRSDASSAPERGHSGEERGHSGEERGHSREGSAAALDSVTSGSV
jgi:L-aspartate oxidase